MLYSYLTTFISKGFFKIYIICLSQLNDNYRITNTINDLKLFNFDTQFTCRF